MKVVKIEYLPFLAISITVFFSVLISFNLVYEILWKQKQSKT